MNDRPIIFSGEMVRAILDGRKTMTRRIIKNIPEILLTGGTRPDLIVPLPSLVEAYKAAWVTTCPYGKVGDHLWCRETWKPTRSGTANPNGTDGPGTYIRYAADDSRRDVAHSVPCRGADKEPWRSPIFMPRWASRITLEITAVRVERLQDMSNEDAEREGFRWCNAADPVDMFMCLWNRLNAKRGYGWKLNPFVWAIAFKTLKDKP